MKTNHLAPATAGALWAEAGVVSRSRRVAVLEVRVRRDGGALDAAGKIVLSGHRLPRSPRVHRLARVTR